MRKRFHSREKFLRFALSQRWLLFALLNDVALQKIQCIVVHEKSDHPFKTNIKPISIFNVPAANVRKGRETRIYQPHFGTLNFLCKCNFPSKNNSPDTAHVSPTI